MRMSYKRETERNEDENQLIQEHVGGMNATPQ